jgi:hypothetical protein
MRNGLSFGVGVMAGVAQLVVGTAVVAEPNAAKPGLPVVGWVEDVLVGPNRTRLSAKLDTGAQTSSASATQLTTFERGGQTFVRFALMAGVVQQGELIEASVNRWVVIRRAGAKPDRRPVVDLDVCVAGLSARGAFTLTDRAGQDYPILIGRAFLAGRALVDAEHMNTAPEACQR